MADDEFDEESLRAAALKSMAALKAPSPEPKFTPLPKPELIPSVSGMQPRPIPSRVPFTNSGPMNFNPNHHFQNQFNFRNHYNNSHNYNNNYNNGYPMSHPVMNLVPPINQFRHQHHNRPPQFNYQLRPGNFHQPSVFHNQSHPQFHPHFSHYNNNVPNNQAPRNNKEVSTFKPLSNGNGEASLSQSANFTQNNSNDSPIESRRLPERFSRIERSDSESDEDDRLDEFVDDEKSRDSSINESHEVINYEMPSTSDNGVTEQNENDLVLSENVDYDDLLFEDEIKKDSIPSQESLSSESPVHDEDEIHCSKNEPSSDKKSQPDSEKNGEEDEQPIKPKEQVISPTPLPNRRVVVVARDTPEKSPGLAEIVEKVVKPTTAGPKVVEPIAPRKIRLKVDCDVDAIERRRLKFGSTDDGSSRGQASSKRVVVSPERRRNVRIPSYEGDDRESSPGPNRKKLRSFVVLKK